MSPLLILTPFIHLNVPEANVTIAHLIPFIDLNVFEANATIVHSDPLHRSKCASHSDLAPSLSCMCFSTVLPLFILISIVAHHVSAQYYHCSF